MPAQEDENVLAWQEQLLIYRRNLKHLLQQAAQFGGENSAPLHIANDLLETRTNITRLKSQLRAANVPVENLPDEAAPATPTWKLRPPRIRSYIIVVIVVGTAAIISLLVQLGAISFQNPPREEQNISHTTSIAASGSQATIPAMASAPPVTVVPSVLVPDITPVAMTKPNFVETDGRSIRLIVIRATNGYAPGDYNVLRNGGITVVKDGVPTDIIVSDHYYIDKSGDITQFVQDKDIAFHAGTCNWVVDGEQIADKKVTINNQEVTVCNALSIAVTLSNRNDGNDPYTALQYDALLTLIKFLVTKYDIPQSQLVRSSDISSKQPLNGFPQWSRFVRQVYNK